MIRIQLAQFESHKDWLLFRRTGIGGSDASAAVSQNRYKTALELWLEKTNQVEISEQDAEVAYWGHTLESVIREEFEKRSGIPVTAPEYMYRSEEHPFMLANLDGELEDAQYGKCVFEAKTVSVFKKSEWEGEIPFEYYIQLQHYMAVTGYKGAYIAALIGGNQFLYKFIERDDKFIAILIQKEALFWRLVTENTPPEIDGSDAGKQFLSRQYPEAKEAEALDLGDDGLSLISSFDSLIVQEKQLQEAKQYIENKLKMLLGEHECGVAGNRKVIWKNVSSKRFDSTLLKYEEPELYQQYLKPSVSRRFSVV